MGKGQPAQGLRGSTEATAGVERDTPDMTTVDPVAAIVLVAAAWLMVEAGIGKRQLRLRNGPRCPHCGLRHARGNCTTLRRS